MTMETKKVLEMLAEGKISTEDAERLPDKLTPSGSGSGPSERQARKGGPAAGQRHRFHRILVDSPDRDQVNVRIPLAFMRTGMKLLAVLPPRVNERLAEKGIDLSAFTGLEGQDLVAALEELNLDVEGRDRKKVRIFCE